MYPRLETLGYPSLRHLLGHISRFLHKLGVRHCLHCTHLLSDPRRKASTHHRSAGNASFHLNMSSGSPLLQNDRYRSSVNLYTPTCKMSFCLSFSFLFLYLCLYWFHLLKSTFKIFILLLLKVCWNDITRSNRNKVSEFLKSYIKHILVEMFSLITENN